MAENAKVIEVPRLLMPRTTRLPEPVETVSSDPRKLVRPQPTEQQSFLQSVPRRLRGTGLSRHEQTGMTPTRLSQPKAAASHAEAFYLQKQIQAQTPMVFVMEDGEQMEGVIEWYDRETIKIRNTTRTLIFKRAIKYLYKAGTEHES